MLVRIPSVTVVGMDTVDVTIEVNVFSRGLPSFDIIGLNYAKVSFLMSKMQLKFTA